MKQNQLWGEWCLRIQQRVVGVERGGRGARTDAKGPGKGQLEAEEEEGLHLREGGREEGTKSEYMHARLLFCNSPYFRPSLPSLPSLPPSLPTCFSISSSLITFLSSAFVLPNRRRFTGRGSREGGKK